MARISFIGACAPTQQMGDLDGRIVHARYSVLLTARSIHTWSCAGYARRAGTEQGEPVDARDACVYGSVLCVAGGTAPSSSTSRAFAASIQIQMLCWKIIRGSTRPVLVSCVPCGPSVGLNGGISRRSRVCRMDTWPAVSATMRPRAENTIYLHSEWRSSEKKSLHRTIDLIELIGTMCLACFFLRSGEK